jgi:hypothetical protein
MHKNYRRKNPRHCSGGRWSQLKNQKKRVLNERSVKRRQRDRILLRETIYNEEAWEEIRSFERPVDWWEID